MKHASEDIIKAFDSLRRAGGYNAVLTHLKESYESTVEGLISASSDKVQMLQGNAQTLKEIITLLEHR